MKGWSIEEVKDKVNSHVEIDTEKMIKWRSFESGRDRSMLEEFGGKMEAEVLDKYKIDEISGKGLRGAPLEGRRVREEQEVQNKKVVSRLLGNSLLLVQRV